MKFTHFVVGNFTDPQTTTNDPENMLSWILLGQGDTFLCDVWRSRFSWQAWEDNFQRMHSCCGEGKVHIFKPFCLSLNIFLSNGRCRIFNCSCIKLRTHRRFSLPLFSEVDRRIVDSIRIADKFGVVPIQKCHAKSVEWVKRQIPRIDNCLFFFVSIHILTSQLCSIVRYKYLQASTLHYCSGTVWYYATSYHVWKPGHFDWAFNSTVRTVCSGSVKLLQSSR